MTLNFCKKFCIINVSQAPRLQSFEHRDVAMILSMLTGHKSPFPYLNCEMAYLLTIVKNLSTSPTSAPMVQCPPTCWRPGSKQKPAPNHVGTLHLGFVLSDIGLKIENEIVIFTIVDLALSCTCYTSDVGEKFWHYCHNFAMILFWE